MHTNHTALLHFSIWDEFPIWGTISFSCGQVLIPVCKATACIKKPKGSTFKEGKKLRFVQSEFIQNNAALSDQSLLHSQVKHPPLFPNRPTHHHKQMCSFLIY